MSNPKSYSGNMTDTQAELLLSWVAPAKPKGGPREKEVGYGGGKTKGKKTLYSGRDFWVVNDDQDDGSPYCRKGRG